MAHDMARVILDEAVKMIERNTLRVELNFCQEADCPSSHFSSYNVKYMKNVPFLARKDMPSLSFALDDKKRVIYEGFTFCNFKEGIDHVLSHYFIEISHIDNPDGFDVVHVKFDDTITNKSIVRIIQLPGEATEGMRKFERDVCASIVKSVNMIFEGWNKNI